MKSVSTWLFLVLAVGLSCPTAWAADKSAEDVYTLGEMVVTGDKPGVKDVAITNDITAEEIKATNAKTVAEALQYVPGIVVTTGTKNKPSVSMHGFDSSKVLVLIDGIPYYETNYGKLDLNKIPANVVSKIEVIKGAPSVLYGANAEAGVINIITKQGTEKPWAEANVGFGEHNTYIANVSHGAQFGVLNYWLSYSRQHTDGWRMSDDYETHEGYIKHKPDPNNESGDAIIEDGGFRDNSAYTTDALWTRVGFVPNDESQYFATFHYISSEHDMPANVDSVKVLNFGDENPDNFSKGFGKDDDDIDWGIDLSGKQKVNDIISLRGKLFYHNHQDVYVSYDDPVDYDKAIAHSKYKDYMTGGSLITDMDLLEWYTARFSLHYRGDSHKERTSEKANYYDAFSYTGSFGMENEFIPTEGLTCILGASYDWFEVTKSDFIDDNDDNIEKADTMDEFNPMIGLSYEFKDTTKLYGSVARKTRFPTLQYLYSGKSYNPELEAEHSINYALGISRSFFKCLDASVEGFYSDISNWISRDYNKDGLDDDGQYQNEADVVFSGAEINVKAYPVENLTLSLGYTYTIAKNESDEAPSKHMVNIPKHKIDMGIGYLFPVITTKLDLRGLYMGESYSEVQTPGHEDDPETKLHDYFLLNGRLSKQFMEYLEGYVEVNNIFDKDYYSEESFPGRGRSFLVGLSAKI
ncbi:TonB-dependent receptor plug domain-containing protein [Desulfoplanes sp.]